MTSPRLWRAVLVAAGLTLLGPGASAEPLLPARPPGYVSDEASRLRPDTLVRLDVELADYEHRTGNEIAVAVVATTDGTDIADYSHDLFNLWGVGQASLDNGVLIVVAHDDRRLRLEVGDGLTGMLSDHKAASIVDTEIVPRLRVGDLDGGVEAGVIGVRRALGDDVSTPDAGVVPTDAEAPSDYSEEIGDGGFGGSGFDDAPLNPFPGVAVLGIVVSVAVLGTRLLSSGGGPGPAFGAGRDRCPNCGDLLGRRGRAGHAGARYWNRECSACGYGESEVRGGEWGRGAGLFGILAAMGTGGGSHRRSDDHGLFADHGASGGFSSGSSGSSGSSSVGGGGSSSGGGASGSW